ncbi:MAG: phosphoglycerate kinase [Candidatus Cloacimonadota bacterium]|nr:phosphoglycerate kinase [Candidatus Cloacimonadota bacterium]
MKTIPNIQDANLKDKVVLVRVDHNVAQKHFIRDPFRIDRTFGTLFHILSKGGKLILCSHVGRPRDKVTGEICMNSKYDVKPIVDYLKQKLYTNFIVPDFKENHDNGGYVGIDTSVNLLIRRLRKGEIDGIYLPNLRWFIGEEAGGLESEKFGGQLAGLADVFVNDAFGSWQPHTSTINVTHFLPSYTGYLMQQEIQSIDAILNPIKPIVAIIAGSKFDTKIGPLHSLLKKVDHLLLGGVLYNAYLAVKYNVYIKGIDKDDLIIAKKFLELSKIYEGKLIEPEYIVETDILDTREENKYRTLKVSDLKPGTKLNYIVDVDPKSYENKEIINCLLGSKTIFVNAVMGYMPFYFEGTMELYKLIGKNVKAAKLFGGGDTLQEFRTLLPGQYIHAVDNPSYYFFSGGGTILKAIHEGSVKGLAPIRALMKNKKMIENNETFMLH